tara:strand:- start:1894 stop:2538 length:645 start_codon:yes stop_codon:yes gene_type:complete
MKVNVKSLLKDKNVLYVIVFIAAINLVGFLMIQDLNAVLFMFIVGFLTSYFSKNMIIVLLTALIATNLFATSRSVYVRTSNKEGLENPKKEKRKNKPSSNEEPIKAKTETQGYEKKHTGKKPKLDYAETLENAYDNLDNLLGSSAINSMSKETQNLAKKQKNLMSNIEKLEPMITKAGAMLEGLESSKIGGMLNTLEKSMGKLTGINKREKEMN